MTNPDWRPEQTPRNNNPDEWQEDVETRAPSSLRLHIILFLLTVLTTLAAGVAGPLNYNIMMVPYLIMDPALLLHGIPFAASLLAILTAHEMGHYVYSRYHGVKASLPYFLPSPWAFGTFGAVIVTRSLYPNRKALMDIGAAGPIAGFIVALPITAYGVSLSTIQKLSDVETGYVTMGDPLILKGLTYLVLGPLPEGHDIFVHPVAFAGWFGFLVTMLNLMPVSQLDGGHILYALAGGSEYARKLQLGVAMVSFAVMGYLGIYFAGWYVWAALLLFMSYRLRFRHPPSLNDYTPLDMKRKIIGAVAIVIMIVTFIPVPFAFPEF